jgi:hypothetical protein
MMVISMTPRRPNSFQVQRLMVAPSRAADVQPALRLNVDDFSRRGIHSEQAVDETIARIVKWAWAMGDELDLLIDPDLAPAFRYAHIGILITAPQFLS